MGFVRMALRKALAYSATLGVDAALRPRWAAALSRMAPFRTTSVEGVEVFAQSASFLTPDWNLTNATDGWPGTQHVYTRVNRAPLPWHLAPGFLMEGLVRAHGTGRAEGT